MKVLLLGLSLIVTTVTFPNIPTIYAPDPNGPYWDSEHWSSNTPRSIPHHSADPYDPTGISQQRGWRAQDLLLKDGVLTLSGYQPRIYLNPWVKPDGKHYPVKEEKQRLAAENPHMFFKNTEITVYYKRTGSDGAAYAGLVIGCRSSPHGHSNSAYPHEMAHTYYAKFRHDGGADFFKEVTHPMGTGKRVQKLFPRNPLPQDQWIGMKFVVYNLDNERVKLELYTDLKSGADPDKMSEETNWEKVGEVIDDGESYPARTKDGVDGSKAILEGGGVVFLRNTDIVKAEYKYFQVREIMVPAKKIFTPANYST